MTAWNAKRVQLQARRDELTGRLQHFEEALDAPAPRDAEDRATEREDDEVMERLGNAGLAEIEKIDAALARINEGTYGVCQNCGEQILAERLNVLPYTPLCRRCAS